MESQNPQPKPMMDVAPPKAPAAATQPVPEQPAKPTPDPAPKPAAPAPSNASAPLAHPQTLKVHAAPVPDKDDDTQVQPEERPADDAPKQEQAKAATSAKISHPVRQIVVLTVLVMIILCGLTVLVYINA